MKSLNDIFRHNRAALAPLAGVTDSVYRRICVEFGAIPVMTGMVSSEGYVRGKPGDETLRLLRFHESERPIGFQFFGADPAVMAEAARRAQDLEPDFIDINAGCPVKKVVSKGAGSALLRNPGLLRSIVAAVAAVSDVPVTVKIRSGWDQESINAVEVAHICEDAGAQGIIVHPRAKSQGFRGASDWNVIRSVKKVVSVHVIGSGDIRIPADAQRMLDETGADAVMIGRAALGNPWIFRDVAELMEGREAAGMPGIPERFNLALRHLSMLSEEGNERRSVLTMRKFFGWYSRGIHSGTRFRQEVFRAETVEDVEHVVNTFLEGLERMEMMNHTRSAVVES